MNTLSHESYEVFLDSLSRNKSLELAPVITYVAVLMLFGAIGNILVCCFYGKKSKTTATNRLIVAVAITDFVVCVLLPKNIAVLCLSYRGYSVILCKINVFVNHTCAITSGMLLVAIASFRYRAVCKHAASQFNIRHANIAIGISVGIALSTSIPVLFIYETVNVNFTLHEDFTISGYDCNASPDDSFKVLNFVVSGIHFTLFAGATVTFIILYSIIGCRIWKYYKTKRRLTGVPVSREQSRGTQCSLLETQTMHNDKGHRIVSETGKTLIKAGRVLNKHSTLNSSNNHSKSDVKCSTDTETNLRTEDIEDPGMKKGHTEDTQPQPNTSSGTTQSHEEDSRTNTLKLNTLGQSRIIQDHVLRKDVHVETTLVIAIRQAIMLLIITVIFVLSFLPYLSMSILRTMAENRNPNDDFQVWVKFCQNSYLLNSASNPFVYGFFSLEFRRFVKKILCRAFRWRFKNGSV